MAVTEQTLSVDLVDGTKIVVPDSLNLLTTYILQEQGDWFEDEIKFLRQVVQPGQVVIDIGANYGVYALSLARRVGPTGQVWAFEPASDTAAHLASSITANATPWVRLEALALTDHEGTGWLRKPGQSELNSLASADGEGPSPEGGEGERVTLSTLDACMARFGWGAVDLLKIDAEGEEKRILAGGRRLLSETSPLVMFELKEGAKLHLDLLSCFQALGYGCYRLVPGLGVLEPFAVGQPVDGYLLNLFAAKPDRAAALAAAGWLVEQEIVEIQALPTVQTDLESGLALLQAFPYARALASRWQASPDQPGAAEHRAALAAWAQAHQGALPVAVRLVALKRSCQLLWSLAQAGGSASRWASLARVAMELGERERAVQALARLKECLQQGGQAQLKEPFLAPHPAYEAIAPGETPDAWLEAATLEAEECYGSFSSFFTGTAALPRLQRLQALGLATPAMGHRLAMLQRRCPEQMGDSVRPWFDFLELDRPLRCLDGGAMGLGSQPEPWVRWAQEGCAEVIGFEPQLEECERLTKAAAGLGGAVRYLPVALGDGEEHTLHITNAPMTSSLFAPARATVDLFPALGELMQVERRQTLRTCRLDDLEEVRPADFLKLDVQGAELMVLQQAKATLADVAVVQCEVEFVELYEGQPLMAEVDAFLRSQGFCFLKFTSLHGRPFKPLHLQAHPKNPISQLLWADAVYVRDVGKRAQWSRRQLQAAAFLLHELYKAFDLVSLLLGELDGRQESDWQSCYLASLLMSELALSVS